MPASKRKRNRGDSEQAKKSRLEAAIALNASSTSSLPQVLGRSEAQSEEPHTAQDDQSSSIDVTHKDGGKGKEVENSDTSRARPYKIRKLEPPRPFPTVPTSVSATGPRSAHTEGKNYITVTRKTKLGAYLRRCKDLFINDGYVEEFVTLLQHLIF